MGKLKASDFVHLHNHTHYSLLDGLTKVPELVEFVKRQGMEAVAVTDHGTMSGLVELYKECNEFAIKLQKSGSILYNLNFFNIK